MRGLTLDTQALEHDRSRGPLDARLDVLREACRRDPFPAWSQRRQWLRAVGGMVHGQRQRIAEVIAADFGRRSVHDTLLAEVFPTLEGIRQAIRHGRAWMRPRHRGASLWFKPARTTLMPQPLGVVGIIVPWNYPLYLSIGPLIAALAAGNRAMVKLSEVTPRFGELLADLLPDALGPDVVQVVNGDAELAAAFARLPFDHLVFTGSTAVGRLVMRAASEHLVPVTLELGGKSPAIVTPATAARHGRLRHAVSRILAGKSLNAGQTCIAPDYVLLPRAAADAFLVHARAIVSRRFPAGLRSDDYGGIVSDHHAARLESLLADARARGARVETLMAPADGAGRTLPLTLVFDAPGEARLLQEEVFGPILPIVACDDVHAAIDYVNARPRPLALYLFDDSRATQDAVLTRTVAGGVCVNDTILHIAQQHLPFGGVGASGMGHYHGRFGFDAMSKQKPIFRQSRVNAMEWLSPPYDRPFIRWMTWLLTRRV